MVTAGILLAITLIMAIGATGAGSEAIFDQADIAAAKDNLASVVNAFVRLHGKGKRGKPRKLCGVQHRENPRSATVR